jgi:hypothetical protein
VLAPNRRPGVSALPPDLYINVAQARAPARPYIVLRSGYRSAGKVIGAAVWNPANGSGKVVRSRLARGFEESPPVFISCPQFSEGAVRGPNAPSYHVKKNTRDRFRRLARRARCSRICPYASLAMSASQRSADFFELNRTVCF